MGDVTIGIEIEENSLVRWNIVLTFFFLTSVSPNSMNEKNGN